VVLKGGTAGRYVPTGHLVFANDGAIFAAPFDLRRLEVTGPALPVMQDVRMARTSTGAVQFCFSANGTAAYISPHDVPVKASLLWVDRAGTVVPVSPVQRAFSDPYLSPDGRFVVVVVYERNSADLWLLDIDRQTWTPLTAGKDNIEPLWSLDGARIFFSSNRNGAYNVFSQGVDGGPAERLLPSSEWQWPSGLSPDGRALLFTQQTLDTHFDIRELPLDGDRRPRILLATPGVEQNAKVSPDGRWLSYDSNESGRIEVHVRPYKGRDVRWVVSQGGGIFARWSRDGRRLFFVQGNAIMEVAVPEGPTFTAGKPRAVVERQREVFGYDVTADGRRFLIAEDVSADPLPLQIVVAPDWFEELKSKVPPARD
jgi:serine/threonine-protein kinase